MDEDWSSIVKNDCLLYSSTSPEVLQLHSFQSFHDRHFSLSDRVKMEPDDTSDYHGSASGSPSSSLSSLQEHNDSYSGMSVVSCGLDALSLPSLLHSPSNGHMLSHLPSPLPPVSHFSLTSPNPESLQDYTQLHSLFDSGHSQHEEAHSKDVVEYSSWMIEGEEVEESYSPSSSPSPIASSFNSSTRLLSLQQARTRSKMHEMALHQRLISEQDPRGCGMVQLSAEEKRTLQQEGYTIPTHYPLTKAQEEALKIVRRKIKNKLSAQESRRKRKEYMDTLEQKIQQLLGENTRLKGRVKQLESQLAKGNALSPSQNIY